MRQKDQLDKYYESLEETLIEQEDASRFPEFFYNSFLSGQNKLYHKEISENKIFEEDWINTLESYFPSIDKIINNPMSAIRYETEVVDIERAKKTNSESVRHLASHTQFIREVNKSGVVPKKILTTFTEQEFGTYENRFFASLIIRLAQFVNSRYKIIKENVDSYEKNHVNLNSNFDISGTNVSLDINMVIKKTQDSAINEHNQELLKRVEKLSYLINGFRNSQFIKDLEKLKRVNPPIIKTNIILKNPDFKNAYTLWLYLDRYTGLFYNVNVKEKNVNITEKFNSSLNRLALMTYSTVQNYSLNRNERFDKVKEYDVLRKRQTKITTVHPEDVVEKPEGISVGDNTVSEFFLNQYKKIFEKNLDQNLEESSSYEVALKKSLREVIAISNSLFDSIFNVEDNEDIFTRLVTKENPEKDYEEAKKKFLVAKSIREIKEVDYQNSIRLEKRLLKEMETSNNKLIREVTQKKTEESRKTAIKKLDSQLKNYNKNKSLLKGQIAVISKEKDEVTLEKQSLQKQLKNYNEKAKAERMRVQKAEQEKLKQAIKKLEEKNKEKLQKMLLASLEKEKQEKEKLALKLAKEKAKKDAKLKALKELEKEKARKQLETIKKRDEEKAKKAISSPAKARVLKSLTKENSSSEKNSKEKLSKEDVLNEKLSNENVSNETTSNENVSNETVQTEPVLNEDVSPTSLSDTAKLESVNEELASTVDLANEAKVESDE